MLPKAPFNVASSTIDPTLSKLIDLTIVVSADYLLLKIKIKYLYYNNKNNITLSALSPEIFIVFSKTVSQKS